MLDAVLESLLWFVSLFMIAFGVFMLYDGLITADMFSFLSAVTILLPAVFAIAFSILLRSG